MATTTQDARIGARPGCRVIETALGWIGLAWSGEGIVRVRLPDHDKATTLSRLPRGLPGASAISCEETLQPTFVNDAIDRLQRFAAGEKVGFSDLPIDLEDIDDFRRDIYAAARRLAHGETVTYGELASLAGHPGLARETGQALGRNPVPIIVPCHRIVAAGGLIGGFSAPGGSNTKRRLLEMEGALLPPPQAAFAF